MFDCLHYLSDKGIEASTRFNCVPKLCVDNIEDFNSNYLSISYDIKILIYLWQR